MTFLKNPLKRVKAVFPLITLAKQLDLFSSASVLDVGCGEGRKLHELGGDGRFRIGVDLRERLGVDIDFVKADAAYLPFQTGMFDIVFANEVMSHVWNVPAVFVEMLRVSRETVFIKDTNFMSPLALLQLLRILGVGWLWAKRHPNRISKQEDVHSVFWFKRLIGRCGSVLCGRRFNSRVLGLVWKYFGNDVRIKISKRQTIT